MPVDEIATIATLVKSLGGASEVAGLAGWVVAWILYRQNSEMRIENMRLAVSSAEALCKVNASMDNVKDVLRERDRYRHDAKP